MVIAVFIRQLSLGGAEKQSMLLARELQMNYRTYLVVWSRQTIAPEYLDFIEENGISVVYLKGNALLKFFRMWRFLKENRVTHLFNFLLINNFVGGLTGRMAGVKHIYGGIRNCEIAPSKLRAQRLIHNFISHKTIFNNFSGTKKLASQGFNKDKMVVVHNGIDVNHMAGEDFKNNEPIVIFTAARFLPQKDHLTALKVIRELRKKGKNIKYFLAGYGRQEAEIRRWIEEMDLQDTVELLVAPSNLKELFCQAHVYLSTSLKEGLSNSLMEALGTGLPVVATNVGDNNILVKPGVNGMLAEPGDIADLVRSLEILADDRALLKNMGQKGYDYVKMHFSTNQFLNRYLELIHHE